MVCKFVMVSHKLMLLCIIVVRSHDGISGAKCIICCRVLGAVMVSQEPMVCQDLQDMFLSSQ